MGGFALLYGNGTAAVRFEDLFVFGCNTLDLVALESTQYSIQ